MSAESDPPILPSGTNEACTGCAACAASCPRQAISMHRDFSGFFSPYIQPELCNHCHVCQRTCPVNPKTYVEWHERIGSRRPVGVYAAWHKDNEVRYASSSGGVFSALADLVFIQGGAVVGAAYGDDMAVRHVVLEDRSQLPRLRGSKYVQSEIRPRIYHEIKRILRRGRKVLFSGTPCQVAGLKGYLKKDYVNLYSCDLICFGVPSPLLFQKYKDHIEGKWHKPLASIGFRNKKSGWRRSSLCFEFADGTVAFLDPNESAYMNAFYEAISLRRSCFACLFKGLARFGDLTIADYWGVEKKYPQYNRDDKGTSLVLMNDREKGEKLLHACGETLAVFPTDICAAIEGNAMLVKSADFSSKSLAFLKKSGVCDFDFLTKNLGLKGRWKARWAGVGAFWVRLSNLLKMQR